MDGPQLAAGHLPEPWRMAPGPPPNPNSYGSRGSGGPGARGGPGLERENSRPDPASRRGGREMAVWPRSLTS